MKKEKYIIEKDKLYNKFVVWQLFGKIKIERLRGLKKECKEWIKNAN